MEFCSDGGILYMQQMHSSSLLLGLPISRISVIVVAASSAVTICQMLFSIDNFFF